VWGHTEKKRARAAPPWRWGQGQRLWSPRGTPPRAPRRLASATPSARHAPAREDARQGTAGHRPPLLQERCTPRGAAPAGATYGCARCPSVSMKAATRSITVSQWRFSVWKNGSGTLALIVDARSQ
jgi:hypothetical protein